MSLFNDRTFLLLDHLRWTLEDLEVFHQPVEQWETSAKYRELILFINVMHVVNDTAERLVLHCWMALHRPIKLAAAFK